MPNARNIIDLLEKLQSGNIAVHQNRCAVVRNRNAHCMRCAEVCTSGCISCHDNQLDIDPAKCIGCGTCATACPTGAIEARNPTDADLLRACLAAMRAADGEVVIACDQLLAAADGLYDAEKVVGVKCLGRVEESLLVTLALAGAKRVTLVEGDCATCEHASGWRMAQEVRDTANTLLETWNSPMRVRLSAKLPGLARKGSKGYDESKRQLFSSAKDSAKSAASLTADFAIQEALGDDGDDESEHKLQKVTDEGVLPYHVPERRTLLLDSLRRLGEPQDVMIGTRLWGHVVIDPEKCSSCQLCATFCPTGAIHKFLEEDGSLGVYHSPSKCVKCRCCEDTCMKQAIWISDEVFAVDLQDGAEERNEMQQTSFNTRNLGKKKSSNSQTVNELLGKNRRR